MAVHRTRSGRASVGVPVVAPFSTRRLDRSEHEEPRRHPLPASLCLRAHAAFHRRRHGRHGRRCSGWLAPSRADRARSRQPHRGRRTGERCRRAGRRTDRGRSRPLSHPRFVGHARSLGGRGRGRPTRRPSREPGLRSPWTLWRTPTSCTPSRSSRTRRACGSSPPGCARSGNPPSTPRGSGISRRSSVRSRRSGGHRGRPALPSRRPRSARGSRRRACRWVDPAAP